MHPEPEHDPDEHDLPLNRRLRPYTPPRNFDAQTRRRFLHGTGVLMALPFLDSLPALRAESPKPESSSDTATPPQKYPLRFAALFHGCGINSKHWWAKGDGADMEFGKTLEPLAPLKQ